MEYSGGEVVNDDFSEIKDMSAIKSNRDKFFDSITSILSNFGNSLASYVATIGERTLSISSVVILHIIFLPNLLAYLSAKTEHLPSIDSVILVLVALTIMAFNAILKNDRLLIVVHLLGFIINSAILSMVIFR